MQQLHLQESRCKVAAEYSRFQWRVGAALVVTVGLLAGIVVAYSVTTYGIFLWQMQVGVAYFATPTTDFAGCLSVSSETVKFRLF